VHGFQVHFVEVHPGPDVVENLRRAVCVGDVSRVEAARFRLPENLDGPLRGDERLVVSRDDRGSSILRGESRERGRRDVARLPDCFGIADGLGGKPVLTVRAVQVAAEHPEGEGVGSGKGVKERLLLDGVALDRPDVAPRDLEPPALVVADAADSLAAIRDGAAVSAGEALQASVGQPLDQLGRRRRRPPGEDRGDGGGGTHRLNNRITPGSEWKCRPTPGRYHRSMSIRKSLLQFILCFAAAGAAAAQTTTVPAGQKILAENGKSVTGVRIVPQPDGTVWFLVPSNDRIVQLQADGATMKQWQIRADANLGANPVDLKVDGKIIWFIENGESLIDAGRSIFARLDTETGQLREWDIPGSKPAAFWMAPDGKVWLPQTAGRLQSVDLNPLDVVDYRSTKTFAYSDMVPGPDGALWLTDFGNNRIVRYEPGAKTETSWTFFDPNAGRLNPSQIRFDDQGKLWISQLSGSQVNWFDPKTGLILSYISFSNPIHFHLFPPQLY